LKETERELILDENGLRLEILSRARRMVRVVCRDSLKILDPPFEASVLASAAAEGNNAKRLSGGVGPRGSNRERIGEESPPSPKHPALLSPLQATEDTCLKILDLLSALLTAGGCALLFNSQNTQTDATGRAAVGNNVSTNTEYQAICTGTALNWYGLPPGGLGSITVQKVPHTPQSLVDACMLSGRSIAVEDGTADPRYCAVADGGCLSESPYMAVPLKGREGVVVGVLLAVRRRGTDSYSQVSDRQ
jgi:GAF domain